MLSFAVPKLFLTLLFFAVFLKNAHATPDPMITGAAAPRRALSHTRDVRLWEFRAALALRELKPGHNVCYGKNGICDLMLDMESCPSDTNGGDEWYKCMCGSGLVAAKIACGDCDEFYKLSDSRNQNDFYYSLCEARSIAIAPLPESIVEKWSSFNATASFPGTSGRGGGSTTSSSRPSTAPSTEAESVETSRTSSRSSISSLNSDTWAPRFGTYTTTLDGNPTGTPLPLPTTTGLPPLANSDGSGGVLRWDSDLAFILSIGTAGFSILCGVILVL